MCDDKIYIIRYEDLSSSGEYSSGISYVFSSLEKAKIMLGQIKQDIICESERDDITSLIHDLIYENGFIVDYIDNYEKYIIEERNID